MTSTSDVVGIGYFVFGARDVAAWRTLLCETLGLAPGELPGAFRIDARAARIFVEQGDDDLHAIGIEARDASSLASIAARARASGAHVTAGGPTAARGANEMIRVREPGGVDLEVFCGPATATPPAASSRWVTGDLGGGHVALRADDVTASRTFFEDVLGFRLSDHIRCELVGGYRVDITFLHVNRRHHSIALGTGMPKHLHHFMLQVSSLDELGVLYDRCCDAGVPITQTIGRHPNDRMVSFYARTPSGFEVELGYGGIEVDDATWSPTVYDRISVWGHRRPSSMKNLHRSDR